MNEHSGKHNGCNNSQSSESKHLRQVNTVKYAKKMNSNQTAPLVKLIPGLVAGVVIASLSASVTANQLNNKLQTPAQVEQALTALLDSREATLQLASYTGKQSASSAGQSIVRQAATKKVDHSQKSIAELVLAGLAITSEAKDELSSSATAIELAVAVLPQDYAVDDIVSVEDLEATTVSGQVSSNISELDDDAIPALPVSELLTTLLPEEQSEDNDSSALLESEDRTESVEAFAMINADETEIVETEASDIAAVETDVVEADVIEAGVTEAPTVETDAVEADFAETTAIETDVIEAGVTEAPTVETDAVEADLAETTAIETDVVEAGVTEAKFVQSSIAEAEVDEEVAPSIVELEESAPIQLASISTSASLSAQPTPNITQNSVLNTLSSDIITNKLDANVTLVTRSAGCPEDFNKVSIPINGKMCQIFAADFPASMILFIPQTPEEVIQYYLASSANFVEPKTIKQRTMLKSADNNTTLIISKDGGGTQVDILVKSPVI